MSQDETRRLLAVASSLKVRVLLSLGYGCGLRAGEVVRLKVKHIDSAQKIIRIEQSKSRKDRNVVQTLTELQETLVPQRYPAFHGISDNHLINAISHENDAASYATSSEDPGRNVRDWG
jgi:integrase